MTSQVAPPHRFTLEDVQAMYAAGILVAENRVELVDGQLIEMNPPGPRHSERVPRSGQRHRGRPNISAGQLLVGDEAHRLPARGVLVAGGRRHVQDPADRLDAQAAAMLIDEADHLVRSRRDLLTSAVVGRSGR